MTGDCPNFGGVLHGGILGVNKSVPKNNIEVIIVL
jgi:hypothetical protein